MLYLACIRTTSQSMRCLTIIPTVLLCLAFTLVHASGQAGVLRLADEVRARRSWHNVTQKLQSHLFCDNTYASVQLRRATNESRTRLLTLNNSKVSLEQGSKHPTFDVLYIL